MAEEETTAQSEKVIRTQRVFINLLDSYSSGNIGKVSSGGSERNPDPQLPVAGPRPATPARSGAMGPSRGLSYDGVRRPGHGQCSWDPGLHPGRTSSPPGSPGVQRSRVQPRVCLFAPDKGRAQDHRESWGQDLGVERRSLGS